MKKTKNEIESKSQVISNFLSVLLVIVLGAWIYPKLKSTSVHLSNAQEGFSVSEKPSSQTRVSSINPRILEPVRLASQSEVVPPVSIDKPLSEFERVKQEKQELFSQTVVGLLEDRNAPLTSVCASLGNIDRIQGNSIELAQLKERLYDSVSGRHGDPTLDSMQAVFRFTRTRPDLRGLFGDPDDEARGRTPAEMEFNKFQATKRYAEQLENLLDQTYLMFMLGRAVETNNEVATYPEVMEYCSNLESDINRLNSSNFRIEKTKFLELLARAEVDPGEIGFDANYKTKLNPSLDGEKLTFNGGWVREILDSDF